MWLTAIFETGPVRYMSVRAGGQTAASTDGHGQRPCEPVDPGDEGSAYEDSLLGSAGVIAGLGLVMRPPLRGWAASFRGLPPEAGIAVKGSVDNYQHALYVVNVRKRHPKPEVEEALVFAELNGWTVRDTAAGHKWGDMRCPEASREGCRESIWSTPKSPGNHAKRLKARVRNCPHTGARHD